MAAADHNGKVHSGDPSDRRSVRGSAPTVRQRREVNRVHEHRRDSSIRVGWALLAAMVGVVAALSISAAMIPEHQVTSCEVTGGQNGCTKSTLALTGAGPAIVVMSAALVCVVPAVWPRRYVSWGVVALLATLSATSFALVGSIGTAIVGIACLAAVIAFAQHRMSRGQARADRATETSSSIADLFGRTRPPPE
ncbi:hypothetical protein HQ325_16655 [Rhodococcus sp. BP-349]|uniref:hypothetical protein n=1 Tax=unclassified Rhodococcus (in: high G+C Gram-positive bacteria) TaxID=192944 RepID=UPI001C9A7040|nr:MULTISPECIES: hypothetical protein [unclassified Rhodococcus (in: high G+C Gram-positive bacteria)]MBY6540306.1 hypothetical protein [Rhodococcus sp. BP-363]MBY6545669.1 hypothetical protein [Rhodococcus sp. BP-369]MBY6564899.1 hypothetical protein [Rhodococcus sp. BP-370]MBY6578165.1 hypothetical protein [Rhodococcus sp. BP-364]MBY6587466.1 hypothetical protein [Rhodococcus sp. BP-358]